jgi:hypothetical protein
VAAQVLVRLGADLNRARQQVIQLLHSSPAEEAVAGGPGAAVSPPRRWMEEIRDNLAGLEDRLKAIERHLGMHDEPAGPGEASGEGPAGPGEGAAGPGEVDPGEALG